MRLPLLVLLLAPLLACADVRNPEPLSRFPQAVVTIATPNARLHRFKVWVADTQPRREQGLMFIEHMDEDAGMLFLYPSPRRISMWMKNTYIPLDMVFIQADGRVASVVKRAKPESLDIIDSDADVIGVLEINGGVADKLAIVPGAMLSTTTQNAANTR
jgi:uncharacterized membrane protein (UPF0127 family)